MYILYSLIFLNKCYYCYVCVVILISDGQHAIEVVNACLPLASFVFTILVSVPPALCIPFLTTLTNLLCGLPVFVLLDSFVLTPFVLYNVFLVY